LSLNISVKQDAMLNYN